MRKGGTASVYYCQRKPENRKNGVGLGTRLGNLMSRKSMSGKSQQKVSKLPDSSEVGYFGASSYLLTPAHTTGSAPTVLYRNSTPKNTHGNSQTLELYFVPGKVVYLPFMFNGLKIFQTSSPPPQLNPMS